jgi:hypothetical protein
MCSVTSRQDIIDRVLGGIIAFPRHITGDRETLLRSRLNGAQQMALHYFHLSNGTITLDDVGTDLAHLADVQKEVVRVARDLLSLQSSEQIWTKVPWKVWATDKPKGAGQTIAQMELKAE